MRKKTIGAAALFGVIVALVGCGADPTESDEYAEVEAQAADAQADLEAEQQDHAATADSLADTEAALADTETALADTEEALADTETALADAEQRAEDADAAAEAALQERDEAQAEAERLRQEYDPQIRAELQAEVDAEIARATQVAIRNVNRPINKIVEYDSAWEPVMSKKQMLDAVRTNAAPERNKTAEQRAAERLAAFAPVVVDEVVKNPAAYEGTGVVLHANIVQYDTNTGPCAFHANFRADYADRSFDYDERAQFGFGDTALSQALADECPALDGIDNGDFVKIWATGAGPYTYSTSIGGSNTIPVFSIDKIELIQKD